MTVRKKQCYIDHDRIGAANKLNWRNMTVSTSRIGGFKPGSHALIRQFICSDRDKY